MKAEHRHELKTNDLAKSLMTFPDYVRAYGGKAILGLAIIILAVVLIMQRISSSRTQAVQSRDDLAYAINQIQKLTHVSVFPDGRVTVRPAEVDNVRALLQKVRNDASDKSVLAAAAVAQGDYAWAMANYPELPAATTQASLRPDRDRSELLKEAQAAYEEVLSHYSDQTVSVIAARFGLGALAETHSKWDEAKSQYEAVSTLTTGNDGLKEFKDLADAKLKRLESLREPVLIGEVPAVAETPKPAVPATTTSPATHPATSAPAPAPHASGARPTTRPSATTRPSKPVK
jgi:hypothetical protein